MSLESVIPSPNCEDLNCLSRKGQVTFFCNYCDSNFCDPCWQRQLQHSKKKRGPDGLPHEKTDRAVVERLRRILEPSSNPEEQRLLHQDDEDTTWFGIGRNAANKPNFQDYGRYATIMAESLTPRQSVRYPHLVSFIGQTGKYFC